ncbi:MAG TPA: polyprenyl synthetase family protein [Acidimicrobiales bacterium]|nr:polyprenyl synthetase family protein [Acidimicrobiales bacterium]
MNVVEALRLPGIEVSLARVEETLREATAGEDPFLSEVAGHLVRAGGKRLRPALVVAAAQACGADPDVPNDVVQGGVAVELVHLGSLYHDDVMDEATSRRGVESANAKWGNLVAILAGDFLLARASEIAASLGTEVAALLARTIGQLCEGEVGQLRYAFDTGRTEEAYLASIGGKTASLMATAARIGGLTAGAPRPFVEALTDYGYSVGMTFQIWDDVRDLVSTEDDLGKPAGHDMVEGTYTLPVLRALAVPGLGGDLAALLGSPLDPPSRDKARDLVLSTPAVESSIATGREWAGRAADALDPLRRDGGCGGYVDVLAGVGHRLLDELGY